MTTFIFIKQTNMGIMLQVFVGCLLAAVVVLVVYEAKAMKKKK